MSESRSHAATPRHLARASARFGRPQSTELTSAAVIGALLLGLPPFAAALWALERSLWTAALTEVQAPVPTLAGYPGGALAELAQRGLGLAAALVLVAWCVSAIQRGGWLRAFASQPSSLPEPVDSAASSKLNRDGFAIASMTLAKWLAFTVVLLWPLHAALRGLLGAWQRTPTELLEIALRVGAALLLRATLALAALGVLDFAVQQWLFRRRLRMTRRQLIEEQRATEADSHVAAERRRRAHELRAQATLHELSEVSLLVCDSDGRALGLRLDPAPVVWIKAEGELAARLRARAAAGALPVALDPQLTAALNRFELNEALPAPERAAVLQHLRPVSPAEPR